MLVLKSRLVICVWISCSHSKTLTLTLTRHGFSHHEFFNTNTSGFPVPQQAKLGALQKTFEVSVKLAICHHSLLSSYIYFVLISLTFPINSLRCLSGKMDTTSNVTTRTILHDLYEKHRQSPYYDNLCRPVSDLLPFIDSGIRGITTNPAVFLFFLHLLLLSFTLGSIQFLSSCMHSFFIFFFTLQIFERAISSSNAYNQQLR